MTAVQQHAASFIAHSEASTGAELPRCIKEELDAFLGCIILQHYPNCGARELKVIAAILERPVIEKILPTLGLTRSHRLGDGRVRRVEAWVHRAQIRPGPTVNATKTRDPGGTLGGPPAGSRWAPVGCLTVYRAGGGGLGSGEGRGCDNAGLIP